MKTFLNLLDTVILLLAITNCCFAQNQKYDIRLKKKNTLSTETSSCYNVQIRSSTDENFKLAGQNYRLFYDATDVSFNATTSHSKLPTPRYTPMVVVQDIQNVNATGFGDLPFMENLSFLNFYMDLNNLKKGGVNVPAYGGWKTTSVICFDHIDPDVSTNGFDAVWGRPGKTDQLATAFVEVSEWKSRTLTVPCERYMMVDQMASDAQNSYDIRLKQVLTSSTESCYDIQVKTNNFNEWMLSSQNYRLFFDAGQVHYNPAKTTSLLPSQYLEYTDVNYFNGIDANSYGNLSFDNNLGFLNGHIVHNDLDVNGIFIPNDQTWYSTVNICFDHISPELLDESKKGFDAVWAEDGLTNGYAPAFIVISEYFNPNSTGSASLYETFNMTQEDNNTILPRSIEEETIVSLYPNPTTEILNIELKSEKEENVLTTIYNASGKKVLENNFIISNSSKDPLSIDVGNLPTGTYFVKISQGSFEKSYTFYNVNAAVAVK